ncbi:MAG TPA: Uma2 family endonuclease [Blastocatellia bacterium]|nr:Uma2 family endonuclease [Blastocatellia bacterium]
MSLATVRNLYEQVGQMEGDSLRVFHDVSWEEYEELLEAVSEAGGLRISFDDGTLQVMTLSTKHEFYADLILRMVSQVSLRFRIKVLSFGSATMKKRRKRKGLEPDGCFYVQTADALSNKIEIDFSTDPPPDIAVEIDIRHNSLPKFPIYTAFGIPEIWRWDGQALTIYTLEQNRYSPAPASIALPMLTSEALTGFLSRAQNEGQYEVLLAFEDWLDAQRQ